jgi:PTS system N-acetylgalactosamine-specific IIB component
VIALLRVDNRLVHGQILETWMPRLSAHRLLVADDESAHNALARAALTLALPDDVVAELLPVEEVDWRSVAARGEATLVIFREVADLVRATARGLAPDLGRKVNLGNVHFGPGRRPVTPSVFLSAEELSQIGALEAMGFEVEARAIPSDDPTGAAELSRRWQAAG